MDAGFRRAQEEKKDKKNLINRDILKYKTNLFLFAANLLVFIIFEYYLLRINYHRTYSI